MVGVQTRRWAERRRAPGRKPAAVAKDKRTGLPVIQCCNAATRDEEMTPERVAEVLNAQESAWVRQ